MGAGGLVFLPYLAGERAPIDDERARGVLAGLSLGHGAAHIVRAVLEAGGYALRHVAEPIPAPGIRIRRMVVSGASDRLRPLAQMRADTLGVPVDVPALADTAAVGAGHPGRDRHGGPRGRPSRHPGDGPHRRARRAETRGVRPPRRSCYGVYRALYPATADLQHRLADIGRRTAPRPGSDAAGRQRRHGRPTL